MKLGGFVFVIYWFGVILELVMGVKLVCGWGNLLGKKWISCLLFINILIIVINYKIVERFIK